MKNKIQGIQKIALLFAMTIGSCNSLSADPFRKGNDPQVNKMSSDIVTRIEHIIVPTNFLNQWQLDNENKGISYAIARTWVENGKGILDHSMIQTHVNNQRSYNNTGKDFIYPTRYVDQGVNSWPVPKDFEVQPLGYSAYIEAIAHSKKKLIESKSSHHYTNFVSNDYNNDFVKKTHKPGDVFSPKLHREKIESSVMLKDGHMTFIGSSISKQNTRLVFQKSESIEPLPLDKKFDEHNITVSIGTYEIKTQDWSKWANSKTNAELRQSSWDWLTTNEGEDRITVLSGLSYPGITINYGKKFVFSTLTERHPVTYKLATKNGQEIPAITTESALVPSEFQDYKLDKAISLSAESIPQKNLAELKIRIQDITKHGKHDYHRVKGKTEWVSDLTMPIYSKISQRHGLILTPEKRVLMAVVASRKKDGTPDSSKRILYFIHAK